MLHVDGWLQYQDEPKILSGGRRSHWFVDASVLFDHLPVREAVLDCWLETLKPSKSQELFFVPVMTGGLLWAEALEKRLGYGQVWESSVEELPTHAKIAVIEDVITTGMSAYALWRPLSMREFKPLPIFTVVLRAQHREALEMPVLPWMRVKLPLL